MPRSAVIIAVLAAGCGRWGFGTGDGVDDGASATPGDGDGTDYRDAADSDTASSDGLPPDDVLADTSSGPYYTFGTVTGPLLQGSGCYGSGGSGAYWRTQLYGDLPNGVTQDQTVTINSASSFEVRGLYQGSGQTPMVSITITDPNNTTFALPASASWDFGLYCISNAIVGTYTVHIANIEPTQTARSLSVELMGGTNFYSSCPWPAGC